MTKTIIHTCLVISFVMIICAIGANAETNSSCESPIAFCENDINNTMPLFTSNYGFYEYYNDLKEQNGGLFRSWSPEDKATIYAMIPALATMEEERVRSISPEFSSDLSILSSLYTREYTLPLPDAITESEAISLAKEWVVNKQLLDPMELDNTIISVSFLANNGIPAWNIAFYDKAILKADTFMNAYTGEFSIADCQEILLWIYDYSEKNSLPRDICLSDLFYKPSYDFQSNLWTVCFVENLYDAGIVYYINDSTHQITAGPNG